MYGLAQQVKRFCRSFCSHAQAGHHHLWRRPPSPSRTIRVRSTRRASATTESEDGLSQSVSNGILAHAAYLPRYVLTQQAARGSWPSAAMRGRSRTVPALDEDVITMAADASLAALETAGIRGSELSAIFFASSSSPYVVKSAAAVVADYVGASSSVCVMDFGAGTHAGLLALVGAMRDTALAEFGPILVVGADASTGAPSDVSDLNFGAGAAAFIIGTGGFADLQGHACRYSSYTNQWQSPGQRHLQRYDDERFERTTGYAAQMEQALEAFVAQLDEPPDWYALALTASGDLDGALTRNGVPTDRVVGRDVVRRTGDTGCASVLINLGLALDAASAGSTIMVQAYGAGAGTVSCLIRATSDVRPAGRTMDRLGDEPIELTYVQFAKHRGHLALPSIPSAGSAYAASPAWERRKKFSVGLCGQRCTACGSINFPRRDYCLDCRSQELDVIALPRTGTIVTFNLQHILPIGPEEAPLPVCTVLLEGESPGRYGGKIAALLADADIDAVRIGMRVELVPRRGDIDDGLVKYGWKFRPANGGR